MTTTKWTKYDERGQAYEVAYLCNGQAPCARRPGCGLSGPKYRDCYRTCDPRYALNGTCADPAKHPERFEAISRSRAPVLYAEIRP